MAKVKDILVGLEIAKNKFGADYDLGGAAHDIVYLFPYDTELTNNEKNSLLIAGWIGDDVPGWYHFM